MRKRLIHLASIFTICTTLIGFTAPTHAADTGEYKVISTTELDLIGGPMSQHAHIAPNGESFAHGDGRQLCIYTIEGEQQVCATLSSADAPRIRVDNDTVVWSPDSTKLAFTSDFLRTFRLPGTWVMDAKTGEITQTTGQGYERASILKDDIVFDLSPQWMPDSQHLVFLRYKQVDKKRTGPFVSVLNVATGEVEEGKSLVSESISIYQTGISADGSLLAFNHDGRDMKIMGGLWIYDFNKQDFGKVYTTGENEQTPRVMSFSADNSQLLITDYSDGEMAASSEGFVPEKSPVHIIDIESNKATLVDDGRYVRRAGWSPDGKAIAYIVYDPIQQPDINGLYISTEPGKPGNLVLPGYFIVPTSREGQPILWATNDTLLVSDRERGFRITVVKFGVQ